MTALLVAAALAVAAGSTIALSARDQRAALLALTVALLAGVLIADPLPSPAALGVRLVAALLAVTVLRATFAESLSAERDRGLERDRTPDRARPPVDDVDALPGFGWPAQVLLGTAAAIVGLGLAAALVTAAGAQLEPGSPAAVPSLGQILSAPGLAFAVALFVATLAAGPAILASGPRRAVGAVLVVQAAVELRMALAGPLSVLEHLVIGALVVVVATGVALLAVPLTRGERTA